jgi:hypothetical protein
MIRKNIAPLVTLMKEAIISSETSALTRATWRNILEDIILNCRRREDLKSYVVLKNVSVKLVTYFAMYGRMSGSVNSV